MSAIDEKTGAATIIDYEHHEVHEGSHYFCSYSVASIGAMTTPDDMIQLTWATPNSTKLWHLTIGGKCGATALYKFTEGWTGGGVSPTGSLVGYNRNRNYKNASTPIYYDATEVTGGIVLEQEYVAAGKFGAGESRGAQEWVLRPSENYAVSLYLNAANEAELELNWYEHSNRK